MIGTPPRRYWNANGFGVAIVAVVGAVDWAAYIGAQPDYIRLNPVSEQETVEWVARHGCKLSKEEALAFFPTLMTIPYRY